MDGSDADGGGAWLGEPGVVTAGIGGVGSDTEGGATGGATGGGVGGGDGRAGVVGIGSDGTVTLTDGTEIVGIATPTWPSARAQSSPASAHAASSAVAAAALLTFVVTIPS